MEFGGRKEILMRAEKRMEEIELIQIGCKEYVFYKVDIQTQDSGTLLSTCCPSLLNKPDNFHGRMVNLGSSIIYIIGTKDDLDEEEEEDPMPTLDPDPFGSIACLEESGWIDLSDTYPKWRSAPGPTHSPGNPYCVPLSGKIYSLGHPRLKPEVYDHGTGTGTGSGGCWVDLPPPPTQISASYLSHHPIPDPQHDRILFHVANSESAIYAFEPNNNTSNDDDDKQYWKRLSPPGRRFLGWRLLSATVDGVVCFLHSARIDSIAAYDLADSASCLQVEWSNHSPYPSHLTDVEFDALIDLGNGFFCLAVFTSLYALEDAIATRVYLTVLSIKRQTHRHAVTFTYHYCRAYDLPDTISVVDYVSLGE